MIQDELQALCHEWQGVLRLQDWDFYVKVKRQRDFSRDTSEGEFYPTLSKKEAAIYLLDQVDYPPDCLYSQDEERILVHELIHAHFAPFWDDAVEEHRVHMEQAIEAIAKALVSLKRGKMSA